MRPKLAIIFRESNDGGARRPVAIFFKPTDPPRDRRRLDTTHRLTKDGLASRTEATARLRAWTSASLAPTNAGRQVLKHVLPLPPYGSVVGSLDFASRPSFNRPISSSHGLVTSERESGTSSGKDDTFLVLTTTAAITTRHHVDPARRAVRRGRVERANIPRGGSAPCRRGASGDTGGAYALSSSGCVRRARSVAN